MWQTDVSFVFKQHRCSARAGHQSVKCRGIRVPITRSLCAGGLEVWQSHWPLGGLGGGEGDIDESLASWPDRVICQEFHYRSTSNLWCGVFIVAKVLLVDADLQIGLHIYSENTNFTSAGSRSRLSIKSSVTDNDFSVVLLVNLCDLEHFILEHLTPWSESESELYRPSDRRLSAKWLPTFADRGCHLVSVTYPCGRILGFLDRIRYFSIK
jgi:hypothetical protein